jgi:hypothetical protein
MGNHITDWTIIDEFFLRGHFDVCLPNGQVDEYDNAIPDYYASQHDLGELIDTNGSEASVKEVQDDGTVLVDFFVYEREFAREKWDQKNFRATGILVEREKDWVVYEISKLEDLPDDYNPFPNRW